MHWDVPCRASSPRGAGGRLKRKRVGGGAENTRMRALSQRSRYTPQIYIQPKPPEPLNSHALHGVFSKQDTSWTDLAEKAVGAAVAVVVQDDLLARADEASDGGQGGHARAERERLVAVFQFADLEIRNRTGREREGPKARQRRERTECALKKGVVHASTAVHFCLSSEHFGGYIYGRILLPWLREPGSHLLLLRRSGVPRPSATRTDIQRSSPRLTLKPHHLARSSQRAVRTTFVHVPPNAVRGGCKDK